MWNMKYIDSTSLGVWKCDRLIVVFLSHFVHAWTLTAAIYLFFCIFYVFMCVITIPSVYQMHQIGY